MTKLDVLKECYTCIGMYTNLYKRIEVNECKSVAQELVFGCSTPNSVKIVIGETVFIKDVKNKSVCELMSQHASYFGLLDKSNALARKTYWQMSHILTEPVTRGYQWLENVLNRHFLSHH